ncbi:MAG: cytochrome c oxidase assembly protein [Chloroflexi bacterium]|nr:cytochrome c oxidase assembly protein [Chloroflexota bacterium]
MNGSSEPDLIDSLGEFASAWDFTSTSAILLLLLAVAYLVGSVRLSMRTRADRTFRPRFAAGLAGFALLGFALAGPLDVYSVDLFALHTSQHIVISMFAAPLLLIARPMPAYIWAFPRPLRVGAGTALTDTAIVIRALRLLTRPAVALPLFLGTLYGWHIPEAYNASLQNEPLHLLMHFTMFASAVLFWWPVIGPPPIRTRLSYPQRIVFLLLAVTPAALLAAIITLSKSVIFEFHLDNPGHFNWSPTEDQRIGGLLMWIPANFVFLTTMAVLFFKWFGEEERKSFRKSAGRPGRSSAAPPPVIPVENIPEKPNEERE